MKISRRLWQLSLAAATMIAVSAPPQVSEAGRRSAIRDALDDVNDAIDRARDEGRRCKRAVLADLKDARHDLKDLRDDYSGRLARRVHKSLRRLRRDAEDDCGRKVAKRIKSAYRALDDLLDHDDDRGDRRGRRGDRGEERRAKPKIPCWNEGDAACRMSKNGQYPMNLRTFNDAVNSMRKERNEIFRKDLAKSIISGHYITVMQLGKFLDTFNNEIFKKDVARLAASKVIDRKNAFKLRNHFRNSILAKDAVRAVQGR